MIIIKNLGIFMKLIDLELNKKAVVSFLDIKDTDIVKYLKRFGIEKNALVEVAYKGFFNCSSVAIRVNDHVVAIGKEEAKLIIVNNI